MIFDEDGFLEEPCLSCDKSYIENIWHEWCCDDESGCDKKEGKELNERINKSDRR